MAKERVFNFKQFSVKHKVNAMKVCTEACILGAYAPHEKAKKVLDIGTGTGLLTLMGAQRNSADWIGIELVEDFSKEAKENVAHSPWKDRITIVNQSFEDFSLKSENKFDFIISNPPFYSNQLSSTDSGKNIAWHSSSFDHENFVKQMESMLTADGNICLLLPLTETEFYLSKAKEAGFFPSDQLLIKNRPKNEPFRAITTFSRAQNLNFSPQTFVIYQEGIEYTLEFKKLLWPFYTIFKD